MTIHLVEFQLFGGHLLLDVLGGENGLEVHPSSLGFDPVFKGVLDEDDTGLGHVESVYDWFDVRTGLHHEQRIEVVVQDLLGLIDSLEDEGVGLGIRLGLDL